jgi:sodium transport system permease protein
MNWRDIRTLYMREMVSALRERTIVTNSILIPIILYPALIWLMYTGFTFVSGQNEEMNSRVMLKDLPAAHDKLGKAFAADDSIALSTVTDPVNEIRNGSLDALVEFRPPTEGAALPGNFRVRVTYDESRDQSSQARRRIGEQIATYRQDYIAQQATTLGISAEEFRGFTIESLNVSSGAQMGRFVLGMLIPILLIVMLSVGGFYPAIDSTAGERENSTWETMMTAATSRSNVMVAKYLYVATMSFAAGFLNLIAMMFSMSSLIGALSGPGMPDFSFRIPVSSVPVIVAGAVFLALFISAGMMILASFARTYKEGQSMIAPFHIALMIPVMFLQGPGVEFSPMLAMIPVINAVIMIREAIQGIYQWPLIGITLTVEVLCILAALKLASMVLRHEDFVTGTYSGGVMKFARERLLRNR